MALGIYKKGQGYYTRLCTSIAYALLVAMGAWWVWQQFVGVDLGFPPIYASAGAAVIVIGVFGVIGFWLVGRRARTVDFLVATEGEMKKVNWSTRQEVAGSTVVVICFAIGVSLFCKLFDLIFVFFFSSIDVLETST